MTYSIDGAVEVKLATMEVFNNHRRACPMVLMRRQAPAYLRRGKLELPTSSHWSSGATHQSSEGMLEVGCEFDGSSGWSVKCLWRWTGVVGAATGAGVMSR
jgi:hypothetical protein